MRDIHIVARRSFEKATLYCVYGSDDRLTSVEQRCVDDVLFVWMTKLSGWRLLSSTLFDRISQSRWREWIAADFLILRKRYVAEFKA
jgi:hypothetical protein